MKQTQYLKGINMILVSCWALLTVGFLALNMMQIQIAGFMYYVSAQMLVVAVAASLLLFIPRFKKLNLSRYSAGLCLGLLLIIVTALVGFYTQGVQSEDSRSYMYYSGGDSAVRVSSHSPLVAVQGVLADPSLFIASFFSDCSELKPINIRPEPCTDDRYFTGVAIAELMLLGSMVLGSALVKRHQP